MRKGQLVLNTKNEQELAKKKGVVKNTVGLSYMFTRLEREEMKVAQQAAKGLHGSRVQWGWKGEQSQSVT